MIVRLFSKTAAPIAFAPILFFRRLRLYKRAIGNLSPARDREKASVTEKPGSFVKSYGCQMNVYDSGRIGDLLGEAGFAARSELDQADIIVLNTCHIREKASEKIYSELGLIRQMKEERAREGRNLVVGVAGCLAQAEGEEILRRAGAVDFVIGPQSYHRLPQVLDDVRKGARPFVGEFDTQEKFDELARRAPRRRGDATAFVTVQEGCDKFCSFCVVPYTRGPETSRPVAEIIAEVEQLAAQGVREITLIGQNVNAYVFADGATRWTLARLFERLSEMKDIVRLRYTTSHPLDMGDDLIEAHRDLPKLAPYLHLPVQSGSDRILRAMNRRHDAKLYRDLIARIRTARPDIALSSDFIVGFPGETDEDFEATMALVRDIGFASAFSFKYSMRPGTPGAERADQVAEDVKKARLAALQGLLEEQRVAFNQACIGRTFDVLFEKPGRHAGQIIGKSPYLQSVNVDAPATLIGQMRRVVIERPGSNSLFGRIHQAEKAA
ncbi:MAG: tRNA (N6-isopentenyl adenosine(37)-C2)-methylthiotransferase MiaB [Hyphomicrobiales bacterium]|nr:tRNA (N6-isopentenyl adenosine(37)-C2)-methylthiotransferase MiaB [Hyphomicrobiales bacterium]